MLRILKYFKPFIPLLMIAIILLFIQANADLALPDYMSRIVNVGIQQGGVEEAAPEALRASTLERVNLFLTESQKVDLLAQTTAEEERVFEFLAEVEEAPETQNPIQVGQVAGKFEFREVTFGYDHDQPVIKGFPAEIKPGQKSPLSVPPAQARRRCSSC